VFDLFTAEICIIIIVKKMYNVFEKHLFFANYEQFVQNDIHTDLAIAVDLE